MTLYRLSPRRRVHLLLVHRWKEEHQQFCWQKIVSLCRKTKELTAVGLPSYLVYSYYFFKKDIENKFPFAHDPEYYRRQYFQKFIYDLNQPYLRITECAFTNITIMDREYLAGIFGDRLYPDGTPVIDYIEEIIEHQKVFMEVVSEIRHVQMFTFPVLTYSLLYDKEKECFVDEEFARWCNKHNLEWYDSNFFISNDITVLSSCCRLLSNTNDVNKHNLGFINSIGGTALQVGSCQVNTINLYRIALETKKSKKDYIAVLKHRISLCLKVLDTIRKIIKRNVDKKLLPNYEYGLILLEKQYNTIGITAMYETIRHMGLIKTDEFGNQFYTQEGMDFAKEILDIINTEKEKFDCNYSINVENVPAETANVRLCKKDNELYPEKRDHYFIYSNQWIPLMQKCTIQEKIRLGSELDKLCGGGQQSGYLAV